MSSDKCVYCLSSLGPITIDHVIPRSWYPGTTPPHQEKWKVPCCQECNRRYSKIEKNLLERIGLCLDPKDELVKGIPQKALRAFKAKFAKNKKDALHRSLKRDAIIRKLYELKGTELKGVLPHFGPSQGTIKSNHATVQISDNELNEIGKKFVRGMLYVTKGHYIGADYVVECYINHEQGNALFETLYAKYGQLYNLAPGIEATVVKCDIPIVSLFRFKIWNRLILHGSVLPVKDTEH